MLGYLEDACTRTPRPPLSITQRQHARGQLRFLWVYLAHRYATFLCFWDFEIYIDHSLVGQLTRLYWTEILHWNLCYLSLINEIKIICITFNI